MDTSDVNICDWEYKNQLVIEGLSEYGIKDIGDLEFMDLCVLFAVAINSEYQDSSTTHEIIEYIKDGEFYPIGFFCYPEDRPEGEKQVSESVNNLIGRGLLIEDDGEYTIPFHTMREFYMKKLKQLVTGTYSLEGLDDMPAGVLLASARARYLSKSDMLGYLKVMGIIADEGKLIKVLENFIGDGIIEGDGLDSFRINPAYMRKEQNPDQGDLFPELKEKE